jgi:hypothetical protein
MTDTPRPTLADFKRRLNITTPSTADEQLQWVLDVATAWVNERVYPVDQDPTTRHPQVSEAILLQASRWYARRNTPEGVAGWNELGVTTMGGAGQLGMGARVTGLDPDVVTLLERHEDYTIVGFA